MKLLVLTATVLVSGCSLVPRALNLELDHSSHLTQHRPFTNEPTQFGTNEIALAARWQVKGINLTLSEGYSVKGNGGCWNCPREEFEARMEIPLWRAK